MLYSSIMDTKALKNLTDLITRLMARHKVPGLSITITEHGETVFSEGFGARNLEQNLPATPRTLFNIGSVTKSITAFALLQLAEKGKVSLDDPVHTYIDIPLFSDHPEITIDHLLSHSSGIPALDGSVFPLAIRYGFHKNVIPLTSKNDFLRYLAGSTGEVRYTPGEKFFYNNDMYTCIGFIIEDLTGKTYPEVIRDAILTPLGMDRATFIKEDLEADPLNNALTGYLKGEKEGDTSLTPVELPFQEHLCAPGGLYCSTEELSRYARCLIEKGRYGETKLLSPESVEKLWQPAISTPYGGGADPRYCLGWVREDDFLGTNLMHHAGSIGVSSAYLAILPEQGITIAIAENDGQAVAATIGRAAAALALKADPYEAVTELERARILELIQGSYSTYRDTYNMEVTLEGGILSANIEIDDGTLRFPMVPIKDCPLCFKPGYYIPEKRQLLQFIRDNKTGRVTHATYDRYLFHKK